MAQSLDLNYVHEQVAYPNLDYYIVFLQLDSLESFITLHLLDNIVPHYYYNNLNSPAEKKLAGIVIFNFIFSLHF